MRTSLAKPETKLVPQSPPQCDTGKPEWNAAPLARLRLDEHGFAFHESTGTSYSLSESAVDLVKWIADGADRHDLIQRFCLTYDTSRSTAERDIDQLLGQLQREGLITLH